METVLVMVHPPVTVKYSNNATLFYSNGLYGSGVSGNFSATSVFVSDNFQVTNKTKLFPNPSTGIVKINTQETVSLSVIDVLGKVVYTNNQVDYATNIDLINLQKGVYLVKVIGENAYSTEKLILE
ncbi:MAG: T9SS type A sorting domain-containing protein [Flavobacterium sp.]|nr:T9SS type A sorting domain-containing protein [Flavobacterium sp.]